MNSGIYTQWPPAAHLSTPLHTTFCIKEDREETHSNINVGEGILGDFFLLKKTFYIFLNIFYNEQAYILKWKGD